MVSIANQAREIRRKVTCECTGTLVHWAVAWHGMAAAPHRGCSRARLVKGATLQQLHCCPAACSLLTPACDVLRCAQVCAEWLPGSGLLYVEAGEPARRNG